MSPIPDNAVEPSPVRRTASRIPILLSAAVYPGAGQIMQGRKRCGILYILVFTAMFCLLVYNVAHPLIYNYMAAISSAWTGVEEPLKKIPVASIVLPFLASLIIYFANLVDVVLDTRRHRPMKMPMRE